MVPQYFNCNFVINFRPGERRSGDMLLRGPVWWEGPRETTFLKVFSDLTEKWWSILSILWVITKKGRQNFWQESCRFFQKGPKNVKIWTYIVLPENFYIFSLWALAWVANPGARHFQVITTTMDRFTDLEITKIDSAFLFVDDLWTEFACLSVLGNIHVYCRTPSWIATFPIYCQFWLWRFIILIVMLW